MIVKARLKFVYMAKAEKNSVFFKSINIPSKT